MSTVVEPTIGHPLCPPTQRRGPNRQPQRGVVHLLCWLWALLAKEGRDWPLIRLVRRASPYIVIATAPVILFYVYSVPATSQFGLIDAFFYTGFINNFDELVRLYGNTYYSVRFGLILPGWIMAQLFGPIAGFYVLRYVLTVTALSLYFRCVRRSLGTALAAIGVVVLLATPTWHPIVLWDYVDSTAVSYLLIGSSLLFTPQERWLRLRAFAVGCVFAMAIDSNIWALPFVVFASVAGLVFHARQWKRFAAVDLSLIAVSALLTHGAGIAFYYWRVGFWQLDFVTYRTAKELMSGSYVPYGRADLTWVTEVLQIYVLPFLLLTMFVTAKGTGRCRLCAAAWLFGLITAVFNYYWEFLHPRGGDVLYLTYYRSYLLPCWALLLPCALKQLLRGMSPKRVAATVASLAAVTLVLPLWGDAVPFQYAGVTWLAMMSAVTFAVLWFVRTYGPWRIGLVTTWWLLLLVQLYAASRTDPTQDRANHPGPEENLDLYRLSVEFKRIVPESNSGGEVRFWFANDDMRATHVQATYLSGYSMLGEKSGRTDLQGMPVLDDHARRSLQKPDLKHVVLLSANSEELDQGIRSLEAEVAGITLVSRDHLTSGRCSLETAVVRLPPYRVKNALTSGQPRRNSRYGWYLRNAGRSAGPNDSFVRNGFEGGHVDKWNESMHRGIRMLRSPSIAAIRSFFELELSSVR